MVGSELSFRFTVPGNLLLAGEYAVLEEGGLGLALAVEPRLVVTVYPSSEWEILGRWPGTQERWRPGESATFAGSLFLAANELLTSRGDERQRKFSRSIPAARIELDSSAFFDQQGRKRGFGSSAAVAVAITCALAQLQDRDTGSTHLAAVAAHRRAQGGAGSGYDVSASFFGGLGLFTGGEFPAWQALNPEILPYMASFAGPQSVKTIRSIDLYRNWQTLKPKEAGEFLEHSNQAVQTLARSVGWNSLRSAWSDCRQLGWNLGDAVGSQARVNIPKSFPAPEEVFYKSLGAGNETGLACGPRESFPQPLPEGLEEVQVTREGVEWE